MKVSKIRELEQENYSINYRKENLENSYNNAIKRFDNEIDELKLEEQNFAHKFEKSNQEKETTENKLQELENELKTLRDNLETKVGQFKNSAEAERCKSKSDHNKLKQEFKNEIDNSSFKKGKLLTDIKEL